MRKFKIKKRELPSNKMLLVYEVISEAIGNYRMEQFNKKISKQGYKFKKD